MVNRPQRTQEQQEYRDNLAHDLKKIRQSWNSWKELAKALLDEKKVEIKYVESLWSGRKVWWEIAKRMIRWGNWEYVAENLGKFKWLNKEKTRKEIMEILSKEKRVDKLILKYKKVIKDAGEHFNVDKSIVAGVIYWEQVLNYNLQDKLTDWVGRFGLNTSIGIGQVRVKTAELVEKKWYIPKTNPEEVWLKIFGKWILGNTTIARVKRLENDEYNIYYAAAYLRYMQDIWEKQYPSISRSPGILATLYNIGKEKAHPNPKPNDFGRYVQRKYEHIKELLGE